MIASQCQECNNTRVKLTSNRDSPRAATAQDGTSMSGARGVLVGRLFSIVWSMLLLFVAMEEFLLLCVSMEERASQTAIVRCVEQSLVGPLAAAKQEIFRGVSRRDVNADKEHRAPFSLMN
jgi:hypothetical protein